MKLNDDFKMYMIHEMVKDVNTRYRETVISVAERFDLRIQEVLVFMHKENPQRDDFDIALLN